MKRVLPVFLALVLSGCATMSSAPVDRAPIDQAPMYGGVDRESIPQLDAADATLVEGTTKVFGTREKASAAFVDRGFTLYKQDDLAGAMRRFNQAWLLNPDNPQVYWGFASVLHDRGKYCQAMEMIEKSLGYGTYIQGLYPDAARIITICSASDPDLSAERKRERFQESDELYRQALIKDAGKGYVYASWATAYYWRGQFADSWRMVAKAREAGGELPKPFLSLLRLKMPDTKTP